MELSTPGSALRVSDDTRQPDRPAVSAVMGAAWQAVLRCGALGNPAKLAWAVLVEGVGSLPAQVLGTPTTVAAGYGASETSGRRAINELVAAGLITIRNRPSRGAWLIEIDDPLECGLHLGEPADSQRPLFADDAAKTPAILPAKPPNLPETTAKTPAKTPDPRVSLYDTKTLTKKENLHPDSTVTLKTLDTDTDIDSRRPSDSQLGDVALEAAAGWLDPARRNAAMEVDVDRRATEIIRQLRDRRLARSIACRIARAERLGALSRSETNRVIETVHDYAKAGTLKTHVWNSFRKIMIKRFAELKLDWDDLRWSG